MQKCIKSFLKMPIVSTYVKINSKNFFPCNIFILCLTQCHFSPPAVRGKTKRHHKEMFVRPEYFELTFANSA